MKLYKHPIGTKVKLGDKVGTVTNISATIPTIAVEITFDDGETIIRHEENEEATVIFKDVILELEERLKTAVDRAQDQMIEIDNLKAKMTGMTAAEYGELRNENKSLQGRLDSMEKLLAEKDRKMDSLVTRYEKCNKELTELRKGAKEEERVEPDVPDVQVDPTSAKPDMAGDNATDMLNVSGSGTVYDPHVFDGVSLQSIVKDEDIKEETQVLNETNILKILNETGGSAKIKEIAEKTSSSAKAVYRYCRKLMDQGKLILGKLPAPDFQEENASVWLEGQAPKIEPEVVELPDAAPVSESPEPSPELPDESVDEGDSEGSETDEAGDADSG